MKKLMTGIAVLAIAGSASAAPVDFSSDFSGSDPWGWDSTGDATGTGSMSVNVGTGDGIGPPTGSQYLTTGYAKKLITADGGTDITINYSFDLDISALTNTDTGQQMTLFSIGANGNAGPSVGGVDGARTWVYLVSGSATATDVWGFGVGSGGVWGGSTFGEIGIRSALTEAQQGALHFEGTLTLTDTVVDNTLTVTSLGGYSQTGTKTTGTLSDVGADNIHSYNLGALEEWGKEHLTGDIVFDNFEATVVPEPATFGLVAAFGGAILFIRRRMMI